MERNRVALLVYVLLFFDLGALCAATGPKFQPSGSGDQGIGRYLVTLSDDASEDAAAMKKELATLYGARLDISASSDVRQFTVTMMPARARLLSADPRVNGVAEVPLTAEAPPAALASVSPARRLTPQPSGYGDNGQSGTYTYDGAGNITAIGADTYAYDTAQRLVRSVTRGVEEDYTYDAFGNRKSATGAINCLGQTTCAQPVTVDSTTNHLTTINGGNVTYDAAGNIATISGSPGTVYTYDGSGMMIEATVGSDDRQFIYTADDERIAVKQGVSWTWTVRDLSGKVLREFTSLENGPNFAMTNWQSVKDYVWRDGLLLATTTPAGTLHYHLDHLGTPRLVTDNNGVKVAEHAYYPFGAEINLTPHEIPEEAMKFTGHERDIVAGDGHTLDYMHARYYSPWVGRFLSVDRQLGHPGSPQSLNRYSYALDNPIRMLDLDGDAPRESRIIHVVVNVVYSNADRTAPPYVMHSVRERTEAGLVQARQHFAQMGIALTVKRSEGEIHLDNKGNVSGNVNTPSGPVALQDFITSNVASGSLTLMATPNIDLGNYASSGSKIQNGVPLWTILGSESGQKDAEHEMAHSFGNTIGDNKSEAANAATDFVWFADRTQADLGLGFTHWFVDELREGAAKLEDKGH